MDAEDRFMWMALDLARRGRGRTSPNPMVGAVLTQGSEVVGSGYHRAAGEAHAEVEALRKAGDKARGATLYVNLEPCSHHGRTGPCTEELISAGVSRVVAAMEDPNPLVAGSGFRRLRDAGIKVKEGVLEEKARRLNEVYVKYITRGRPFVGVKVAMSMDGKIATSGGESHWITGEKARQFVHRLRDQSDAIMVGAETVLKDDPRLTTRIEGGGGRDPLRVIVDSKARLPLDARVIDKSSSCPTIVAVTERAPRDKCRALEERGAEIMILPEKAGRVSLTDLVSNLAARQVASLLVEGGGTLNFSLLEDGLIDKVFIFVAPLLIGGDSSPTPFGGAGVEDLARAWTVSEVELKQFDRDLLLIGYPRSGS